jgi:hypothetical protein
MTKSSARKWSENALLVAVAGSLVVIIGQLAGTIIPIMYGPEDISDFSIKLDHISHNFDVQNCSKNQNNYDWVDIKVEDFHKWLRPYRFTIHFQALGSSINDTYTYFDPPDIRLPGLFESGEYQSRVNQSGEHRRMPLDTARVLIRTKSKVEGTFPILIQGIGGDGKIRNATFYLKILNNVDYQRAKLGMLPLVGDEIHS